MSSRFGFRAFRESLVKYRLQTREKRVNLMNYLRKERQRIIERERSKLFKRFTFWGVFLGIGYFMYNQVYRKNLEITKMNRKLDNIYSPIMKRQALKDDLACIFLTPTNLDELTNIISLAYRYHYKIIVRMGDLPKREKVIMCEQFNSKCLFINLSLLNHSEINAVNSTVYLETGASCQDINAKLEQNGYAPLFPQQFANEKVYDVVVNNLPLNHGELATKAVSLEMISAEGLNFRSAGETNRYGQVPSLNPLFLGTGGIFALPSAITIKIQKPSGRELRSQHLKLDINDDNLKVDALRQLNQINDQFIEVQLSNSFNNKQQVGSMFITCKQRFSIPSPGELSECSSLAESKGVPVYRIVQEEKNRELHNLFFSVNQTIFEEFLLKFGRSVGYSYTNGLLKIKVPDEEDQETMTSIINEITNNNGVLVWCSSQELLMRIKPSLDSSEVGAELMRKIVQVREGLDRRNVFYSHNRYEDYFAKGLFRRLTEVFW